MKPSITIVYIELTILLCLSPLKAKTTTANSPIRSSYTREHGESCNSLDKCNYRHWLKCDDGHCECLHPSQMIVSQPSSSATVLTFFSSRSTLMERKSCRARVNQLCKREYFVDDDNNSIPARTLFQPQQLSIPKQTQLCVENAYCHPHGICKCNFNYILNAKDGSCQKFQEYSESCDHSVCHPDHFLKCRRGICQCDALLTYDREMQKCSAGPGDKCVLSLNGKGKIIDNCVQNATCHMGQCRCNRGYVTDLRLRICTRGYGYFCSDEEPCIESFQGELFCVNSTCVCNQSQWHAVYNEKKQVCERLNASYSVARGRPSIWKLILAFVASLLL